MLATGEREAGRCRGNPGCSELVIRSTMLDKQSRLDKELLSVAYTINTKRKPLKRNSQMYSLASVVALLTPKGQLVSESLMWKSSTNIEQFIGSGCRQGKVLLALLQAKLHVCVSGR